MSAFILCRTPGPARKTPERCAGLRPQILFPLFAPLQSLPGIGPKQAKLFEKLVGDKAVHLLWHFPTALVDRSFSPRIAEAEPDRVATLYVRVDRHFVPDKASRPYRIRCADETGFLHLVFFRGREDWLKKQLPEGEWRYVSGKVEIFNNEVQITHPDYVVPEDEKDSIPALEPVYPLTAGLTRKPVIKAVQAAFDRLPEMPEWQDPHWIERCGWAGWKDSLAALHNPVRSGDLDLDSPARMRLAYDELLAGQLALALVRQKRKTLPGRTFAGDGSMRQKVLDALPFALTGSQASALQEIAADMEKPARMLRMLQGDVGSGKTVVALLAMLIAIESGAQGALMVPTEILARQHMATITPLAEAAGIRVALLTGRDRGKAREKLLADLAAGDIHILVGTHALIQDSVVFKDLGLAVIDEQHRFGVDQRLTLAGKSAQANDGRIADILVMTATPIPRSLLLTAYGDIATSRLTEKPAGRKPVTTRVIPLGRLEEVVGGLARAMAAGDKIYWVCPLVEESELIDLQAAEERFATLEACYPDRVALVHGKMKPAEKDRAMASFSAKENIPDNPDGTPGTEKDILVSTTVIEVGVDVPAANIMVIEHAERFGLAQLHQLRGRVGRGDRPASCLLLYGGKLTEVAQARLEIMRQTDDGFQIAEEDLRLRGGGEVLGTRQSGMPDFRVASLEVHEDLLATARDDAKIILETDPALKSPRGEALRILLYLFERDGVIRTLDSG